MRRARSAACALVAVTPLAGAGIAPRTIEQDLRSSTLEVSGPTALDGMSLEEVVQFRRERVARHAGLGLFPRDYEPLRGPSARIWRPITPGAQWLGPTPYYVANPYVLVVLVCANHVTPLNLFCPEVSIVHAPGRIREERRGDSARCWLDRVFSPPYADHPGHVRVVMVNAYDAGFRFAHVDRGRSSNLAPDEEVGNVVNGLFSQPSLFHVGSKRVNNISPEDRRGWIRLAAQRAPTLIHVKLWRDDPGSVTAAPDLVYEAVVLP